MKIIKNQFTALMLINCMVYSSTFASGDALKNASSNEDLAKILMTSLKSKVHNTIQATRAKALLPADNQRLAIQCLDDEFQFQEINQTLISNLQKSFQSKNISLLNGAGTKNFSANSFDYNKSQSVENLDGIKLEKFKISNTRINFSQMQNSLAKMLGNFEKIKFAEIVTEKIISSPKSRLKNQIISEAEIQTSFTIRGFLKNNAKVEERGKMNLLVVKQDNVWKLSAINLMEKEQLTTSQEFFKNVTAESGLSKIIPSHLRREAIRRGGYAMAVDNWNSSNKNTKMLVSTVAETVLLETNNGQNFKKIKNDNLEKQSLVKSAAFADLTNSGNQDLVLVRFAPNESQTLDDRSDIQIFKSNEGVYSKREKVINFNHATAYAMPLALGDFDNDSFIDFYIGFPGARDFTTLSKAVHQKNLTSQGVFYNQKDGSFKDDAYKSFITSNGKKEDLLKIFPHSAIAVDYNQDKKMDLVVVDDRGNLSPIYENKGNGEFVSSSSVIGVGMMDYGMGVDMADLNGDGRLDFVLSSVNFNTAKRIKDSCQYNWSVQNVFNVGSNGLRVFQANSNLTFTETTSQNQLDYVGEGAGGVKVFDYNNDGFPDIYLTTGLWTGSEKDTSQDISPYFVAASSMGILEDGLRSELNNNRFVYDKVKVNNDFKSLLFNSDSQSSIMDLLSFYRGDLYNSEASKKKSALSLAGYQPNRLFRNNGNGTYTEVGFLVGLDSFADGYMAATTNFNQDGKIDLVLRNADPGYDVKQFPAVQMYKNITANKNNSVILKLVGTKSNRDAIGAFVEAKVGKRTLVGQLIANSGTVQSQRVIHFGLGKNTQIESLKVTWPSGIVQNFYNLEKGLHTIEESGKLLSLR